MVTTRLLILRRYGNSTSPLDLKELTPSTSLVEIQDKNNLTDHQIQYLSSV